MIFAMVDKKPITETISPASNDRPDDMIPLMVNNEPNANMLFPVSDDRPEKMLFPEDCAFLGMDTTPTARRRTHFATIQKCQCVCASSRLNLPIAFFSYFLLSMLERAKFQRFGSFEGGERARGVFAPWEG